MAEQCAWASLHVEKLGWINASIDVAKDGQSMLLTADVPPVLLQFQLITASLLFLSLSLPLWLLDLN
jgi:hypothetical protein